jgi:hypothetical protein
MTDASKAKYTEIDSSMDLHASAGLFGNRTHSSAPLSRSCWLTESRNSSRISGLSASRTCR